MIIIMGRPRCNNHHHHSGSSNNSRRVGLHLSVRSRNCLPQRRDMVFIALGERRSTIGLAAGRIECDLAFGVMISSMEFAGGSFRHLTNVVKYLLHHSIHRLGESILISKILVQFSLFFLTIKKKTEK